MISELSSSPWRFATQGRTTDTILSAGVVATDASTVLSRQPLLLTLEFRECCENLGAMTIWINPCPDLGDFSVGIHLERCCVPQL